MLPMTLRLKLFNDQYAAALDRGDLDAWLGFFTEEALYRVTSRDNFERGLEHATLYCKGQGMLQDRVSAIRKSIVFEPRRMRHIVGAVDLRDSGGATLKADTSFVLYESLVDHDPRVVMVGTYVDELVEEGDSFRLHQRACVLDNARIFNSLIYPV